MEKRCWKCGQTKDASAFYRNRATRDGLSQMCRLCHRAYYRERRDLMVLAQLDQLRPDARFMPFGETVLAARQSKGLTQDALGQLLGMGGAQVRLWEKGVSLPRQDAVAHVCQVLDIELPLSLARNRDGHFPLEIGTCVRCHNPFPVYKRGVLHCSRECATGDLPQCQSGSANPAWRGGRTKTGGGYVQLKMPDHPRAYKNGYVLEHTVVMEQVVGRPLARWERVRHKNGVRDDNRPENLELWTVRKKDPPGVRLADLPPPHCPTCTCGSDHA